MSSLPDALGLPPDGLLAAVGAGGKKSLLAGLADALDASVFTSTVHIPAFRESVDSLHVTTDPLAVLADGPTGAVGLVPARDPPDRYVGYDPETVDAIHDAVDVPVLVKADGARMRRFKAPGDHEPVVPSSADVVAPVASVQVVGEPLDDELVHRVDRVAAITGRDPGDAITPGDVSTVLTHPAGGLKGVPSDASVVPVLNMVDDDRLAATARDVADRILADSDRVDRVVSTCLVAEDPVVEVHT